MNIGEAFANLGYIAVAALIVLGIIFLAKKIKK